MTGRDTTGCAGRDVTGCAGRDVTGCAGRDVTGCAGRDVTGCAGRDVTGCAGRDRTGSGPRRAVSAGPRADRGATPTPVPIADGARRRPGPAVRAAGGQGAALAARAEARVPAPLLPGARPGAGVGATAARRAVAAASPANARFAPSGLVAVVPGGDPAGRTRMTGGCRARATPLRRAGWGTTAVAGRDGTTTVAGRDVTVPPAVAGFTLIEALVAMAVLAVAAAGLVRATGGHVDAVAALTTRVAGGIAADNALAEARLGLAPAASSLLGRAWRLTVTARASDDPAIAALTVAATGGTARLSLRGFRDTAAAGEPRTPAGGGGPAGSDPVPPAAGDAAPAGRDRAAAAGGGGR